MDLIWIIGIIILFIILCQARQLFLLSYLRNFLHNTKSDWNYVTPEQLYNDQNKNRYFILDIRRPEDYQKGHIENSTNIFWLNLLEPENINKIPKNKEILLVCYVGHTASQMLVILKLLGYKVKAIKFGMGISPDPKISIAGWTTHDFPTVSSPQNE